jgi:hypothetical protein
VPTKVAAWRRWLQAHRPDLDSLKKSVEILQAVVTTFAG